MALSYVGEVSMESLQKGYVIHSVVEMHLKMCDFATHTDTGARIYKCFQKVSAAILHLLERWKTRC